MIARRAVQIRVGSPCTATLVLSGRHGRLANVPEMIATESVIESANESGRGRGREMQYDLESERTIAMKAR